MKVGVKPGTTDLRRKGDHHVEKTQRQDPCRDQPRDATEGQQPPRLRETREAQKAPTLPTPACQPSGLQN